MNKIKVAVIDMNNGTANEGMRGIENILLHYREQAQIELSYTIFDLRQQEEIPGLDYDIYISSGGPGSPYEGQGLKWENDFFELLDAIDQFNSNPGTNSKTGAHKKYVFLICHSFQMACRKYGVAEVSKRHSTSFGIFPVYLTEEGENDNLFDGLPNPFYAVDSRDWQVVNPDDNLFSDTQAQVLALERERPHVNLERCVMAIRFTNEIVGTQFHPEADPDGMKLHLLRADRKKTIIENHGEKKYVDMLESLEDPSKIRLTQSMILPNFLNEALKAFHHT